MDSQLEHFFGSIMPCFDFVNPRNPSQIKGFSFEVTRHAAGCSGEPLPGAHFLLPSPYVFDPVDPKILSQITESSIEVTRHAAGSS